jgi:hypothetical protein
MLCEGTVTLKLLPLKFTSERRAIALLDVSCQTCAMPEGEKFCRLTVTGVDPETLLMTMSVAALSPDRCAPKAARVSGLVDEVVFTLTLPRRRTSGRRDSGRS